VTDKLSAARHGRVICVGHAALDRVYSVESWPAASAKIAARAFAESGGGMAANAAVAIARLGGEAEFWGPTGADGVAEIIRTQLARENVDVDNLRGFQGESSSHSAVLVDARGERLVVGHRGSALQATAEWLPLARIKAAGALLADVRWPAGAATALQAARRAGIATILDGEIAETDVLEKFVGSADHAVYSELGLAAYCEGEPADGLRKALSAGARVAAVTCGEAGVLWIEADTPQHLRHCRAFPVLAVDTLAAGDVFHGAYALAISEGQTIEQAIRFGAAAAAIKCSRPGGRQGAPTRDEVERLITLNP
jgi:sulfofructose kinase